MSALVSLASFHRSSHVHSHSHSMSSPSRRSAIHPSLVTRRRRISSLNISSSPHLVHPHTLLGSASSYHTISSHDVEHTNVHHPGGWLESYWNYRKDTRHSSYQPTCHPVWITVHHPIPGSRRHISCIVNSSLGRVTSIMSSAWVT